MCSGEGEQDQVDRRRPRQPRRRGGGVGRRFRRGPPRKPEVHIHCVAHLIIYVTRVHTARGRGGRKCCCRGCSQWRGDSGGREGGGEEGRREG